ncbi:MAG: hypothetical protein OXN18_04940 [Gemmatimonadota bacterium]|nr:hypothetical protein [Gemmatimonadota bacterium]
MQKTFGRVAGRVRGIRAGVKVLGLVAALTAVAPALPDDGVPVETVASAQSGPHKLVIWFRGLKFCTHYACGGAPTCCGPVLF